MEEIFRWSDLLKHLEAQYRDVETFPNDCLRFTYDLDGTEWPVGAQVLRSSAGSSWLALATKVCSAEKLRARSALVANVDLPIGGLAIVLEHVVVRQTLPLHGLRVAHLAHTLRALATMVIQLRHVAALEDADIETPYAFVFR